MSSPAGFVTLAKRPLPSTPGNSENKANNRLLAQYTNGERGTAAKLFTSTSNRCLITSPASRSSIAASSAAALS
jgi:hypothetical protein